METLMRILLVEDHTQLAGLVGRELTAEYGHEVLCARDPLEARELYESASFDLAIVDLLFEHLNRAFERRPVPGTLTNGRMLTSGLTTVSELSRAPHRTGIVLYTSAEADRRLHMLYAYEDLGIRVFCSKAPGTGRVDNVADALSAAAAGRAYVDPVLNAYLPVEGSPAVAATLLREDAKRAIWRALALRAVSRGQIAEITGYSTRTIGNLIPDMFDDLTLLDSGLRHSGAPMGDLISYASDNWQFFLDEVVRQKYP
jgi:DNA-binding NarL/FixJ family response regulator